MQSFFICRLKGINKLLTRYFKFPNFTARVAKSHVPHPNPAKMEFFIQSNYKSKATFYMYDLLMQKVMEGEVENGVNRVTMVNNLSTGTYILSIFDKDRNQVYNKILIVNN